MRSFWYARVIKWTDYGMGFRSYCDRYGQCLGLERLF